MEKKSIIDISLPLEESVPVWPGSTGIHLNWTLRLERGEPSNLTRLDMDVHIGTHVEGPLHSFSNEISVDQIFLENFIGKALVVDLTSVSIITADDLEKLKLSRGVERLLFRTKNSEFWENHKQSFREEFVGLSSDAAQWIVDRKIKLVGIDYLSVANFKEGDAVHKILFKKGVVILEGLNLLMAPAGEYELICLPLKLAGREAAPARAVLKTL